MFSHAFINFMEFFHSVGSVVQAAKTSGQLSILRQNIDLAQFVVEETFTGRQLGSGYFGSVEEVR